jgi:formate dehydrogenase maturation protein FdhE
LVLFGGVEKVCICRRLAVLGHGFLGEHARGARRTACSVCARDWQEGGRRGAQPWVSRRLHYEKV